MFKFREACIYTWVNVNLNFAEWNDLMFPKIHVSLLTENDVICIWSIVNLSQLWHLLMAKRIETDQKHIKNCIFSLKYLVNPIKSSTFASLEPAKPLNDAQMCGSFYFYTMSNRIPFPKPYTSAHDLVSLLQSRGLTIADTEKTERYLEFIG